MQAGSDLASYFSKYYESYRSAGSAGSHYSVTLNNEQIQQVQQILAELGYYIGYTDGIYGPKTAKSVRFFMRDAGIPENAPIDGDLLFLLTMIVY
ncbi:MAG: peptidoglycan-binding protein, partial [Deltaproteobacteria bacterium]|jgi:peptidoglycan hydrolase-like protein with peptidoglycan-binding domain|nr:peptidoglycan-binding protein [Deltaproteobacteria bacterium]